VFNKIDTFDKATLDEQLYMQHVSEIDNAPRFLYGNERSRTVERNDDW
jgi:hypothetical protein